MKKINGLKKGLVYALTTAMVASCAPDAVLLVGDLFDDDTANRSSGSQSGHDRYGQCGCVECPFRRVNRIFSCGYGDSGTDSEYYEYSARRRWLYMVSDFRCRIRICTE